MREYCGGWKEKLNRQERLEGTGGDPQFLSPWVVWQAVVRWSLRGLFSDQLLVFIGVATVLVAPPAPPNLAREISVN